MIRPLTAADAEAFTALRLEGIRDVPDAFLMTEAEIRQVAPEAMAAMLDRGGMHGAFDGDRLVGFAGLDIRPWALVRHRAHVGPFYVTRDHRGTGLASTLMRSLADVSADRGVSQLELWVAASNTRARAFYADFGFRGMGRMPAAVRMPDGPRDDILMVRDLTKPPPQPVGDGLHHLSGADWRAFRDIRLDALRRAPRAFGSTLDYWSAKAPDEVASWLEQIRSFAFVEDGRALAVAGWHRSGGAISAHRGHVIAAFTRPEAQRRGLFRQVMSAIIADARARNVAQLELDVSADNAAARAAYGRLGFAVTGGIPRALNHDGHVQNQLCMVRAL